jgi:hypothetical protein
MICSADATAACPFSLSSSGRNTSSIHDGRDGTHEAYPLENTRSHARAGAWHHPRRSRRWERQIGRPDVKAVTSASLHLASSGGRQEQRSPWSSSSCSPLTSRGTTIPVRGNAHHEWGRRNRRPWKHAGRGGPDRPGSQAVHRSSPACRHGATSRIRRSRGRAARARARGRPSPSGSRGRQSTAQRDLWHNRGRDATWLPPT